MSAAVTILAVVLVWMFPGWLGARIILKDWHRSWGDYDSNIIGMAATVTILGPIGLLIGLCVWVSGRKSPQKFWGLR